MRTTAGFLKTLVFVALLAVSAQAGRRKIQAAPESVPAPCTPPPEGVWLVNHYFPTAPGNDTLVQQLSTLMDITTTQIPNVYQGSAGGVAHNPQIPVVPRGAPVVYNMIGIFDPETCTLSGVVYNFELRIGDPFQWYYDGETMSGPYVNADNGVPLFTAMGSHEVTPLL